MTAGSPPGTMSGPSARANGSFGPLALDRAVAAAAVTPWIAASGLVLVLAVALRVVLNTDADVSWLLYVAGRTLDGAIPYRDFLEVNPPASILLYIPAVFLGRLTGISPEAMTDTLVFAATGASLALSGRILLRGGLLERIRALQWLAPTLAVLLVLPFNSFAQREHIIVLAILPSLAGLAVRIAGSHPGTAESLLAGIGAGIAIVVKPVFGLALLGPGLALLRQRSWRVALAVPEAWVALAIAAAYAWAVEVLAPDFASRVLPLVVDIYIPARAPLVVLLIKPTLWIWLGLLSSYRLLRPKSEWVGTVLVLASAGFQACYFIQGKGFAYHGYPAVALAALACAHAMVAEGRARAATALAHLLKLAPATAAIVAAAWGFSTHYSFARFAPGLQQAIAAGAPAPRILTIGGDMPMGRLFARQIGAEWVGTEPIAWITLFATYMAPEPWTDPRFAGPIRAEHEVYADDIESRRPDVVLVEGDYWQRWIDQSPTLVRAMSPYRPAGRYGDVMLYRRDPAAPVAAADATLIKPKPNADPAGAAIP